VRIYFVFLVFLISMTSSTAQQKPLKVGVIGLTHTHVHWIFNSEGRGEIEIVGVVEPNRSLASRYAKQYGFPMDRVYPTHSAMLERVKPEAVTAFGSIYDHLEVVETYAPLGVHIIVEKPLAVIMEHAVRMAELARSHGVELLTNYETMM
jgi:predicted dehydrogenase